MESAEGANFSSSSKCFHSGKGRLLPVWARDFYLSGCRVLPTSVLQQRDAVG